MNRFSYVYGLCFAMALYVCGGVVAHGQSIFYVRAGASGNGSGSDWGNAFTSLPSNMQRGATYYVAGGSYGAMNFTTPTSGTTYITIRKATVADHGSNTGWQDAYGTQQAVFNAPLSFRSSYWIFDGGIRDENNWFEGASYGFVIRDNGNVQIDQRGIGGINNIIIRHTYLKGINTSPGSGPDIGRRHVWIDRQGNPGTYSNWTISRCFFQYGNVGVQVRECAGFICEYNAFADNWSTQPNNHGENVSAYYGGNDGHIYRFNRSRNMIGTAAWAVNSARNWQVYGNVYEDCTFGDGFIGFIGGSCTGFQIYNETIIRPKIYTRQVSLGGSSVVKNSIFMMGSLGTPTFDGATVSSCAFSGGGTGSNPQTSLPTSTFVNYSGGDYRLTRATMAGEALPAPFNVDLTGAVRGADGVADRGAFEFVGSVDVTPPVISNVGVSLANPLLAVITWTTSEPASSYVDYGATTAYGATAGGVSLVTAHSVTLSGLLAGTTYNYRVRSSDAAGNQATSANFTFSTAALDAIAPTVTLTAPAAGSVLSNTVTITATASDNVGVAGVRFFANGVQLVDDTTSPYSYQWDTTLALNGSSQIYAQAYDAAGNLGWSATNHVTIANPVGFVPAPTFHWSFGEGVGTTAQDNFLGSVMTLRNGLAWTTGGKVGTGLLLDGVNDRADVPHSTALNITGNALSVSAWVKLESQNNWQQILVKVKETGAFTAPYFAWHLFGGHASTTEWTPMFQVVNTSEATAIASSSIRVTYGEWAHVAGVYDGATVRIYINGVQRGSAPLTGNIISYAQPLYLGAHGGPGEYMKGMIDEVSIFAQALTAEQVQALFQTSVGPAAPTALRVVMD
jgi:hypothetical protein